MTIWYSVVPAGTRRTKKVQPPSSVHPGSRLGGSRTRGSKRTPPFAGLLLFLESFDFQSKSSLWGRLRFPGFHQGPRMQQAGKFRSAGSTYITTLYTLKPKQQNDRLVPSGTRRSPANQKSATAFRGASRLEAPRLEDRRLQKDPSLCRTTFVLRII